MKFLLKGILFFLFFLLCSCGNQQPDKNPSSSPEEEEDISFFNSRRDEDTDRQEALQQSHQVYKGSPFCSSSAQCVEICDHLFSLDKDKKDCGDLRAVQVDRFKKLYNNVLEKELNVLKEIDVFDLKVFFNLSPEPFFSFFKTLDPVSTKLFLNWIAGDWRVAKVFYNEDWDFLFFDIFFKQVEISPISSLKEEIAEERTFAELAWLKQSDSALFWLDDYFKNVQCLDQIDEEAEKCILVQYCLLSESFKDDVSEEIVDFENLKLILDRRSSQSYTDLKSFCSVFCSSEENQNRC